MWRQSTNKSVRNGVMLSSRRENAGWRLTFCKIKKYTITTNHCCLHLFWMPYTVFTNALSVISTSLIQFPAFSFDNPAIAEQNLCNVWGRSKVIKICNITIYVQFNTIWKNTTLLSVLLVVPEALLIMWVIAVKVEQPHKQMTKVNICLWLWIVKLCSCKTWFTLHTIFFSATWAGSIFHTKIDHTLRVYLTNWNNPNSLKHWELKT